MNPILIFSEIHNSIRGFITSANDIFWAFGNSYFHNKTNVKGRYTRLFATERSDSHYFATYGMFSQSLKSGYAGHVLPLAGDLL